MTVYDIPNIEHCDVAPFGASHYRIIAHEGWYIYQADNLAGGTPENPTKVYRTVALLSVNYDFSMVEITAEADLPPNAEINGGGGNNDHEIM
jgi:hypothetical protein